MDMSILDTVFSMVSCPQCYCISFEIKLVCGSIECDWYHIFWTSKTKKRSKNYDVNRKIFYSIRRIGNDYAGMKRFVVPMDHPSPMT